MAGCTNCSGYCSTTCRGTCKGGCSTNCPTTCKGSCSTTCPGSCKANCANNCQGTCSADCDWGCDGSCSSTCTATCADDCVGSCKANCANDCSGACKDACNTGCTGEAQSTVYANLSLDEKFNQSNITEIAGFIYNEANRRAKNPTSLTFTIGEALNAADITTIISNLNKTGHTTTYTATAGEKGLRELGLDLIAKAKAAYEEVVVVEGS